MWVSRKSVENLSYLVMNVKRVIFSSFQDVPRHSQEIQEFFVIRNVGKTNKVLNTADEMDMTST